MSRRTVITATLVLGSAAAACGSASAQTLTGSALVSALKRGGHVIVVRHARSPRETPDERAANADNTTRERQLDETGRADAVAMGKAMRNLGIPIGAVLTSPTYRARETVRLAQWPKAEVVLELGDRGQSMQGVTETDGAWLRHRVTQIPKGTNTIVVTHLPNITRAFPQDAAGIEDGDALVFGASGNGGATVIGRIKVAEWPKLK